jgi:hypothetical protein
MHRNSHNSINGWETDAYLLAMSYKEGADTTVTANIKKWFVANGSYIRRDKEVVLHSLSKVFLHADLNTELPQVLLQGQPLIRATLSLNKSADNVKLNGQQVKAEYAEKNILLLKSGE